MEKTQVQGTGSYLTAVVMSMSDRTWNSGHQAATFHKHSLLSPFAGGVESQQCSAAGLDPQAVV